jgi:hypothetical protein
MMQQGKYESFELVPDESYVLFLVDFSFLS